MLKTTPFFIGIRYILAKKDNRFISFTTLISMAGVSLGVLALIIVTSVFNGSQQTMRERTLITVPHGDIYRQDPFADWQRVRDQLLDMPGITGVSPYLSGEALFSQQGYHQVAQVKGILPKDEDSVSGLEGSMIRGSLYALEAGRKGVVLGRGLANNLRVDVGDPVNLIAAQADSRTDQLRLETQRFNVVAIFDVAFSIGSNLALVHLQDSLPLLGVADESQGLRLRLKTEDVERAGEVIASALEKLGPGYRGQDWRETEAALFDALKLEKIMTSFMLMMIVAIGAFNIVSTLVMLVSEKRSDIAILRTMGAGRRTVMAIFMIQGSLVGVLGTFLGTLIGVPVAIYFEKLNIFFESLFKNELVSGNVYMIASLPSVLQLDDLTVICSIALLISFLATLYPAYKASKIHPAEVLRYE